MCLRFRLALKQTSSYGFDREPYVSKYKASTVLAPPRRINQDGYVGSGSNLSSRLDRKPSSKPCRSRSCSLLTISHPNSKSPSPATNMIRWRSKLLYSLAVLSQLERVAPIQGIEKYLFLADSANVTVYTEIGMEGEIPEKTQIEPRIIDNNPLLTFLDICNNVSSIFTKHANL